MNAVEIVVIAIAVGWYLSWMAGRVDHLNRRTYIAHDALLRTLTARAQALVDHADRHPTAASKAASEAAMLAMNAPNDSVRAPLESAVSASIWHLVEKDGLEDLDEVTMWARRVQLSRRFHAEAVRATAHIRSRRVVRWFRLAGHAGPVHTVDFADDLPPGI